MKRIILPFLMLLSAVLLVSSCLKDNDSQLTGYEDTAVVGFAIRAANVYHHTVSKAGQDSVYKQVITSAKHRFYVDQINKTIYNPDSLPYGTDASKLLCIFTTKNSGVVFIKDTIGEGQRVYNGRDSLSFLQPREVRVYDLRQRFFRPYTVTVNVHKENGDVFRWNNLLTTNADLAALTSMKLLVCGNTLYIYGVSGTAVKVYSTADSDGKTWQALTPNVTLNADVCQNAVVKGGTMFVLNGGSLLKSTDGATWNTVSTPAIARLAAADNTHLYGLTSTGELAASADDGATWTTETLDSDKQYLPAQDISGCLLRTSRTANGANMLLIGNRDAAVHTADTAATVWSKVVEAQGLPQQQPWAFYGLKAGGKYNLPRLTGMQAATYGDLLVALGAKGTGTGNEKTFGGLYVSKDNGISWHRNTVINLPESFQSSKTSFALAVDAQHNLWIVCGQTGQVWKGRLNRLGWQNAR